MTTRFVCGVLAAVFVGAPPASAQPPQTPPQTQADQTPRHLRVHLDCFDCFSEYLRDEIDFVDFVREPQDADVTILSSGRNTAGGGRELTLRFVGRGRFAGVDRNLLAISLQGDTEATRRRIVLRTIIVGLLYYQAREGLPPDIDVAVEQTVAAGVQPVPQDDPWNLWVFSLSANGSINAEETSREWSWRLNASADRETEDWKISFGASLDRETERFDLDEDEPFEVTQRERNFDWFVAKSWGPHWSFGFDGRLESSTFGNTKFSAEAAPAVEFSLFPYSEYATRRIRFQYSVGVEHAKYNEITLFDKLEETLGQHEFSIDLDRREPWGSLEAGFEFSQYLHDLALYRLEVDGEVSFRIARGLEIDLEGSASRIRDQISLPRRDATPEEVLLRLRELQSGYDVRFQIGLSYTFGSIFNNVVNPRFGR